VTQSVLREREACRISITGVVQGVGFRPFVYNLARRMGLTGWVLNHSGGVDIEVEGEDEAVSAFVDALQAEAPPLARIESLEIEPIDVQGYADFEIRESRRQAGEFQLISPDVATCDDCVRELFDPDDRRYRYPFINCTNCGPRFTIIEDIPYDRPNTTMRVFPLCEDCREEYGDPADRRFHAQPNACPVCGPRIWLVPGEQAGASDVPVDAPPSGVKTESVLAEIEARLRRGEILAIKGLGGFHLVCDATQSEVVERLRGRKRRPHKPFAMMVPTLADAKAICEVPPEAEVQMTSPRCPIVLLDARAHPPEGMAVAESVAPNVRTLGVMLPYTPLHHLILRDIGRPLVMTSGNLTEEPIAKDNAEALRRLAPLADAFVLHNRDIYARYDDSVVQAVELPSEGGGDDGSAETLIQPVRRARGYAPFPIRLPFEAPRLFAAGPLLKNTFALARGSYAFVSQHIGDLERIETLEHYEAALETYQHLFRLEPERVACDKHPDYLSTRFAESYARERELPAPLRIQQHKAHVAACLADNGWGPQDGPVLGVAFDGTGYGDDGAIWGGEWFVGDYHGMERAAHLAYLPLPGGDAAIRHPWRIAVAYLHTLLGRCDVPGGLECPAEAMMVREQVTRSINTPYTSSMGRLFDAVSALLDIRTEISYEAQAAIEMEHVAAGFAGPYAGGYPFDLSEGNGVLEVGLAALFESLIDAIASGRPVPEIAWRFHATVAAMIDRVCRRLRDETGLDTVALSGGVFQNRLLLQLVLPRLRETGFAVLLHDQVPCNDGGVSLGQVALATFALADA
jgi:hydrogenase maturation protein HypF